MSKKISRKRIAVSWQGLAHRIITRQFLVYLAGPITGLSWEEATAWYQVVDDAFPKHIIPMKPLRGKDWLVGEESIRSQYCDKHALSTADGIMMRDEFDVKRADALLVNLLPAKSYSVGTAMEIAWAHLLHKPSIVVMTEDNVHYHHPMIARASSIIVPTLEEAIDITIRLVSPT